MLTTLYDITIRWAKHPKATLFLALLSFTESSFFPIPPDIMLAPMSMAKPQAAWQYAAIATFFSVMGGIFGYLLGYFVFESLMYPFITKFGYVDSYKCVLQWFNNWGFLAVLLAGATPIPYKMFTISAGVLKFNLPCFIIASIMGRGLRFFLLSSLIKFKGDYINQYLSKFLVKHNNKLLGAIILLSLIYIIFYKL